MTGLKQEFSRDEIIEVLVEMIYDGRDEAARTLAHYLEIEEDEIA